MLLPKQKDYGFTECLPWDKNTNMVGQSVDGTQYTYTYDAGDRLISSTDPKVKPATSGAFDANGNYANLNSQTYTYDANQRLTSISGGGTGKGATNQEPALAYVRDPLGRPTQTTDQGKTATLSYVSPGDQMPAVRTDKATGNSTPIVSLQGGLIHTPSNNWITDTQGHAALVLDDNATPLDGTIQQWQPYGQPATTMTPVAGPNPGWHGMPADLNGTIIDLGARTLHTNLTLFTQPDPIHGGSGVGPHNYTPGDPINAEDLDGTNWVTRFFKWVGHGISAGWNGFLSWFGLSKEQRQARQIEKRRQIAIEQLQDKIVVLRGKRRENYEAYLEKGGKLVIASMNNKTNIDRFADDTASPDEVAYMRTQEAEIRQREQARLTTEWNTLNDPLDQQIQNLGEQKELLKNAPVNQVDELIANFHE